MIVCCLGTHPLYFECRVAIRLGYATTVPTDHHADDEEEPAPKKAPTAARVTSIDIHVNSESSSDSDDDDDEEHAAGEKAPTHDETYAKLGMV